MKRTSHADSRTTLPLVETSTGLRLQTTVVPGQQQESQLHRIPLLAPHARQVPVMIVWPKPGEQQAETAMRPAIVDRSEASIAERGIVLRAMIKSHSRASVAELLDRPDAADVALTVNSEGFNALGYAISNNDIATARLLLALPSGSKQALQGAGTADAPLIAAARSGLHEIVDMLLPLGSAREQVARSLAAGISPLVFAAAAGHEPVVQRLLDSRFGAELAASTDKNGVNALMAAAYKGHAGAAQVMLASNHYPVLARGTDKAGSDALLRAAQQGHAEVVRLLLASPQGMEMAGRTCAASYDALYVAAREGHAGVVQALLESPGYLERRAAVASRDPLAAALKNNHTQIAGLLRAKGFGAAAADPQASTGSGSSE